MLNRRLWPRALLTPFTDRVDLTDADKQAYTGYALAQRHKGFETVEVTFTDSMKLRVVEAEPEQPTTAPTTRRRATTSDGWSRLRRSSSRSRSSATSSVVPTSLHGLRHRRGHRWSGRALRRARSRAGAAERAQHRLVGAAQQPAQPVPAAAEEPRSCCSPPASPCSPSRCSRPWRPTPRCSARRCRPTGGRSRCSPWSSTPSVLTALFRVGAARSHNIWPARFRAPSPRPCSGSDQKVGTALRLPTSVDARPVGMNQTFALVLGLDRSSSGSPSAAGVLGIEVQRRPRAPALAAGAARRRSPTAVELTEADQRAYVGYARAQRHKGFENVDVTFTDTQ